MLKRMPHRRDVDHSNAHHIGGPMPRGERTSPPVRPTRPMHLARLARLTLLALLAACGGGGGSAGGAEPPPVNLPTPDISAVAAADPGSPLPEGWQHGAFMQVFVRSYQDSDGDGIGDLRGLTSRLDYLRDLGVKGLWLMPVTASQDADHGYAVADYRDIERAYGTRADLDALIAAAHARGIGVVIDYVMNHSAAAHPLFVNARAAASNAFRDWYVWQPTAPAGWSVFGGNPWRTTTTGAYYAPFWDQMPDFNLNHAPAVEFHKNNLRYWLNRGIDGFRFDAVGMLVENGPAAWENQARNYTLLQELRAVVAGYPRRTLVCEGPSDSRGYAAACGSAFAFDLRGTLIGAAGSGNAAQVATLADYFRNAPAGLSPFASNHDSFAGQRLADQFSGDAARLKLVAAAYLLLPGTPFIYYGEEIGMAGAATLTGDPKLRTPMSWTANTTSAGFSTGTPYRALAANVATHNVAAQQADANSLLTHYKAMLALRNGRPSLARGSYDGAFASGAAMGYQRVLAGERTLVVINFGLTAAAGGVVVGGLPAGASLVRLHPSDGVVVATVDASGAALVDVPAQSVRVYDVR
jgi:alpha-amylase